MWRTFCCKIEAVIYLVETQGADICVLINSFAARLLRRVVAGLKIALIDSSAPLEGDRFVFIPRFDAIRRFSVFGLDIGMQVSAELLLSDAASISSSSVVLPPFSIFIDVVATLLSLLIMVGVALLVVETREAFSTDCSEVWFPPFRLPNTQDI